MMGKSQIILSSGIPRGQCAHHTAAACTNAPPSPTLPSLQPHSPQGPRWSVFSYPPPPPCTPPRPPASSHCSFLLMTYSPLFGKNVHLLCGLLYCYPLLLVVIEPPHISWSHGNLALGLHSPVSLAICDHMTKLC